MKTSPKLVLPLIALTALVCGHSFAAEKKPLKVFILAGQSNMEGHAKVETFDYIGDDPAKPRISTPSARTSWLTSNRCLNRPRTAAAADLNGEVSAATSTVSPLFDTSAPIERLRFAESFGLRCEGTVANYQPNQTTQHLWPKLKQPSKNS